MPATGRSPILLYGSTTAGNSPLAAALTNNSDGCEIAINVADKNLFFKDSSNIVNTVPIRQSSGSSNGWLSSTDWTTFNNKQPAGTYVTTITIASSNGFTGTSSGGATPALTIATSITGILKGNGTAISAAVSGTDYAPATSGTSILYGNGAGGFSAVTIGSGVSFVGGTLSATGSGGTVTSVTGTAPVVSSGGTTPVISMAAANGSTNGYLTSTDWTTFNSKQPAGTYVTSITIASANGFTGTSSGGATPALTIATSITGVLKGNGTAISAAVSGTDYAPATSGTAILYGNGAGGFSSVTIGSGVSFSGGTLSATGTGGTVTSVAMATGTTGLTVSGGTTQTITSSGTFTIAGTLAVTNGGTGLTTLTAGYIPYGNGTSAFSSSSLLFYNATGLGVGTSSPAAQLNVSKATTDATMVQEVIRVATTGRSTAVSQNQRGNAITFYDDGGTMNAAIIGRRASPAGSWYGDISIAVNNTGLPASDVSSLSDAVYIDGTNKNVKVMTGNLVIGTSGKGIDFSITSQPSGMTSELLADYEEGTWTPTAVAGIGGGYGASGVYTKIGRVVYCTGSINLTSITGNITMGGLPYTSSANVQTTLGSSYWAGTTQVYAYVNSSATTFSTGQSGTYSGGAITCYFAFWYSV